MSEYLQKVRKSMQDHQDRLEDYQLNNNPEFKKEQQKVSNTISLIWPQCVHDTAKLLSGMAPLYVSWIAKGIIANMGDTSYVEEYERNNGGHSLNSIIEEIGWDMFRYGSKKESYHNKETPQFFAWREAFSEAKCDASKELERIRVLWTVEMN